MIAIKTQDLTQDFSQVADRVIKGEKILISQPQNENLVLITEKEYKNLEQMRESRSDLARIKARESIKKLQQQANESGAEKMTMEEINAEIMEYRNEKNS